MDKNTCTRIKLGKGEMHLYECGKLRLHAYKTNDFMDDEVFLLEKDGRAVAIESPCFFDNNRELEAYMRDKGLEAAGVLLAYHMAGASFLPHTRKFSTRNAEAYGHSGGGRALIDNFARTFGPAFDSGIHTVTDILEEGPVTIGGIPLVIRATPEAFDVEIPEINAVYTHMLGHDCHSIVAGTAHADALIAQLKSYLDKGYTLVLTSHYTPEDLKDVETNIAYLEDLKAVAAGCKNAAAFKAEVQRRYGAYSGENYLDMTAGFFFTK